jgi:diguanylate cyclase (GGDEF)-like protein
VRRHPLPAIHSGEFVITARSEYQPWPARDRYGVLIDIGRVLAGTLSPGSLYATIHEQCARLLESSVFVVSVYAAGDDVATIVYRHGIGELVAGQYRGSASRALREGRPGLHPSGEPDALWGLVHGTRKDVVSAVTAPLIREGRVMGELAAFAPPGRAYGQGELEGLAALAELAAIAVGNVLHVEEIDRRRREAERMEEIGQALVASLELGEVLARVTAAALSLCDADGATVWLLEEDAERVRAAYTTGPIVPRRGMKLRVPDALRALMDRGEAFIIEDRDGAAMLPHAIRIAAGSSAAMAVPLSDDERVIGALSVVHCTPRRYRAEEVRLLERLGIYASIALANAALHERIRSLSLTDPLTGLPNRRHLEMFLEREFAAAMRGRPLALLIFDLDNFKNYNDLAGHDAGDDALRAIGALLTSETRRMNLAARYGGDEFVAVLSGTDGAGALRHAERIAAALLAHPLLGPLGITASIGIAVHDRRMTTPAELIRAADQDMYARKVSRE